MKKIISIILAAVTALCLFIPALAAENSRFGVTVVSENDTKAVVSIDFNGGTAFNCLDFEVELSNRVSVEKCAIGAGLRNFKIYAQDNYEDINSKKTRLTEEKIKQFEEDVKKGKEIKVENYTTEVIKNYNNKISSFGLFTSKAIGSTFSWSITKIFSGIDKMMNN